MASSPVFFVDSSKVYLTSNVEGSVVGGVVPTLRSWCSRTSRGQFAGSG